MTKGQMKRKLSIDAAKERKRSIDSKYDRFIPDVQLSGNVTSTISRVEEVMTMIGIKRKRSQRVGTKQRCSHFSPLNWMEGDLAKMGKR